MLFKHKILSLIGILAISSGILAGCGHTGYINSTNHIKRARVHKQTNKHIKKPLIVNKNRKAQHEKQSLWQKPKTSDKKNRQ